MDEYPKAYWSEWADKIIQRYDLKPLGSGSKEWHGACPNCGHNDWPSTRFWINEKDGLVKFACRQCNDFQSIVKIMEEDNVWPLPGKNYDNVVSINSATTHDFDDLLPYHIKKKVDLIGADLDGSNVVVPLFNTKKEQVGIQTIYPDSSKRFNKGLSKNSGVFGVVGTLNTDEPGKVWLAEGWATSVSIKMALQANGDPTPVLFGLDKSNLAPVCDAIAETWPQLNVFIAADNDADGGGEEAARKTKRPYAIPKAKNTDFNDLHVSLGLNAVAEQLNKIVTPESILNELVWIDDAEPVLKSNYLIKGWIGAEQMTVIYGQSNVGKSFFTLDLAYHIAAGRDWHGARVKQGTVLYLAAEGGQGYLARGRAIQDHYGDKNVPLAIRPSPVNLLDPNADLPKLFELIDLVKEKHGKIELIIVDTLSRAMAGGNENAPEAMTSYIANSDSLAAHGRCSVLTVHHSGKAGNEAGARGHSSLRAATSTEIELDYDEVSGIRFARATKQRDIPTNKEFAFELQSVELGKDEDGDPVTSCYILPVSDERKAEAKVKLSPNENLLMECFTQLWGEQIGKENPGGAGWPQGGTRWCILEDDLKEHYYGKTNTGNQRQSYKRARDGLIKKGEMAINEGFLWLARNKHKIGGA